MTGSGRRAIFLELIQLPRIKEYLQRRVTPAETVILIVLIAIIAGLGYATYNFVTAKILEAKVRAAVPVVTARIRERRQSIEKAIEAYKAQFGSYPQDNVLGGPAPKVDAVNNPLLYELAGVLYNPTNKTVMVSHFEPANADYVQNFFHCKSFRNFGQRAEEVKNFLDPVDLCIGQLHDDPDVFVLRFAEPFDAVKADILFQMDCSSWRYVSSSPTNNPGRFDLWIDVTANGRTITIGNWPAAQ